MGIADIIPGVSGGTLAFILGIYQPLLNALKAFNFSFFMSLITGRWKKAFLMIPWTFLIPLLLGIVFSTALLGKYLTTAFYKPNHCLAIFSLFLGLILSSCGLLLSKLSIKKPSFYFFALLGMLLATLFSYLQPSSTLAVAPSYQTLFFCGVLGAGAMLAPGISGSYLMLVLGMYGYIVSTYISFLSQLSSLSFQLNTFLTLVAYLTGVGVGLGIFSRLIDWCLQRHYHRSLSCIIGFILASLKVIWPFRFVEMQQSFLDMPLKLMPNNSYELILSLGFACLGFGLLYFIHSLESYRDSRQ